MSDKKTIQNISYIGIGRFSGMALQAIFYLIFASLLGPEKYGELNVLVALAATFSVASRFGLNISLQVYQAKKQSEVAKQIKSLFILSISAGSLILLIFDVYAAILCASLSFFIMNQQDLLGLFRYKKFMIYTILKSGLFFILPFTLYFVLELPGIVIGMSLANFIASAPFFKSLKIISFNNLKSYKKTLFQNFLVDISNLLFTLDKLLVSFLFGFLIVGIYQFNLQIYFGLGIVPLILYSFLVSEEATNASHRKLNSLAIIVTVIIAISAILLAPFFVTEFFPAYLEGVFALQILLIALIPQSIGVIYFSKLIARESKKIGFLALSNMVILLGLITILGNNFGLEGLSYAILISSLYSTSLTYVLYSKTKKTIQ